MAAKKEFQARQQDLCRQDMSVSAKEDAKFLFSSDRAVREWSRTKYRRKDSLLLVRADYSGLS